MASKDTDLVGYCLPDFSKCAPAVNDLVPAIQESIAYFTSVEWLSMDQTGTKDWNQSPVYACWYNIPLCLGSCCIPCCTCAVIPRNLAAMTGNSCESEALKCCLLSLCCYMSSCWMAKKRGEFRKKYNLKGTPMFDCLGCCCCGPCMVCQDANALMELEADYVVPFASLQQAKDAQAKYQENVNAVTEKVSKVTEKTEKK